MTSTPVILLILSKPPQKPYSHLFPTSAKLKTFLIFAKSFQFHRILTIDEVFAPDHNGARTLNVVDFLLGKTALD